MLYSYSKAQVTGSLCKPLFHEPWIYAEMKENLEVSIKDLSD